MRTRFILIIIFTIVHFNYPILSSYLAGGYMGFLTAVLLDKPFIETHYRKYPISVWMLFYFYVISCAVLITSTNIDEFLLGAALGFFIEKFLQTFK